MPFKYERLEIPDIILIKPKIFGDNRGYFLETYSKEFFKTELGLDIDFCQDNESKSSYGVLRGIHYQKAPYSQAKLVRVVSGRVLDVAVDLRKDSRFYGKHVAVELNDENKYQLFIPRGFGHAFVVLSEEAVFSYKVDNIYAPDHESGVIYNDPALSIDWKIPEEDIILAEKDKNLPNFKW